MYGYVYLTANKVNGKVYVGQHKGSEFDRKYYGSGTVLKKAINKYGLNNFVCKRLEMCEDLDTLNEREIYWIAKFDSTNKKYGYNITIGGSGRLGCKAWNKGLTAEDDDRILAGINCPNYGKELTQEQKDSISKTRKEKGLAKGKNNPMYGKEHSEETRNKISELLKGKRTGKDNHESIGIIVLMSDGELLEFDSVSLASKYFNINYWTLISGIKDSLDSDGWYINTKTQVKFRKI